VLVPDEENVAQHEVLCAMVNNCSGLGMVGVILRIRIHCKDRILIFARLKQKIERKKEPKVFGICKKLQPVC
jgi:hypothetical protein